MTSSRVRTWLVAGLALAALSSLALAGEIRGKLPTRPVLYSPHQMEAYLSPEQAEWIRPGFDIQLVSLQIPEDRRPVVEVRFVDDMGQPLDRLGRVTPGTISVSFVLAWYDAAHRDYVAYTTRTQRSPITGVSAVQASADSGGSWTDVALGTYRYRFGTTLPESFRRNVTTTLGIYGSRNLSSIIGKTYYDNVLHDFRPDGGAVTEQWDAMTTDTCNACHDPLALHGGSRREVKLCVLCHNATQSLDPDTGNSVEMRVMIHKIHNGPNLAHGYTIIGFGQAVHDYAHVTYPQDVRNCTTCHRPGTTESHIWYANPSRVACGSCHDSINWETGEGHIAGPQFDDRYCTACHLPEGESEFDVSVKGAHTVPTKSAQLPGLVLDIRSVTNTGPGQKPTVTFTLKNKAGGDVDPASLTSLYFLAGGPTGEYTRYFRENARAASNCSGGVCTYTFGTAIPADATGTWTLSADYYRNVVIDNHTETGLSVRDAGMNPIVHFAVTDAQPVPRRAVVDNAKCNKCHDVLALHGGQRFKVEECAICHHPNETDTARRPADQQPAESVHFKYLIHKIHTGEELARDFTVYGFGNTPHNYNEVLYPGDRRNCEACHTAGSYGVPLPEGTLPTPTLRDWYSPMQPAAAACLSCHGSVDAAAHAYTNTAPFGESCASCHGADREFAVVKVHAR